MRNLNQLNMGSVHVHKKVFADIVSAAIESIDGASLMPKNFWDGLKDLLGYPNTPGIEINIDDNNEVTIGVKVFVRYGMNIPDMARQIQDVVRSMLDKTVDVNLKDINVSIQGIERGEK